ncbi:MAG TPA: glycosyl hydrolase family 28-related protein [Actinopolymorphaceae bacterium]
MNVRPILLPLVAAALLLPAPADGSPSSSADQPASNARLVETVHPTSDGVVADYDAVQHGADPAGTRDSTAAIQTALDACYERGGGTVWLPAGTYRVTDTLEVKAFCTLRGDRRDPDEGSGAYGTILRAELPSGDDGPSLVRIGGSAGVRGVTTYYPHQDASDPVPYNYTFEIPGHAWIGTQNYMMSTVADVTMLNSYRGIGISTMPSDQGLPPSNGQVHESSTIRNVKGTVLFEGARAYNGADVGTWENVRFDNGYWARAGAAYNAPRRAELDAWTRAHGTGFVLGDLEWEQFAHISASDYRVGIHVVPGQRISFAGVFLDADIRRTDVAVLVDHLDARWGMAFAGSRLEGSEFAIDNAAAGYVKVTDTKVRGERRGIVHELSGKSPSHVPTRPPSPAVPVLYDATAPPFSAPRGLGKIPEDDATEAIQQALDHAGRNGGGIVYLPAGWYLVSGHLEVPRNVELRGSSAVPHRDQLGLSGGTVLLASEGRNALDADTAPALVSLTGAHAGVRGLRVFHPGNNPASPEGLVPYPYAIRAQARSTYVIDVGMPNAWNGIEVADTSHGFVLRKVTGAFFAHAVTVRKARDVRIEGLLSNGNAVMRVGYGIPGWATEDQVFPLVIDKYMREQAVLVTADGSTSLSVFDAFGYGFHDGLVVRNGDVTAVDLGTDNLGTDGYTIRVKDREGRRSQVRAVNVMRYNGTTSLGSVDLLNLLVINMEQNTVIATADPPDAGTVRILGIETEPDRYETGSQVTVVAEPRPGHRFVAWTVDSTVIGTSRRHSFTVTSDQTVVARFARSR